MLLSFLFLFDLFGTEVILLVNSQAMLNYSKEAEALKDVFRDTLALYHRVESLYQISGKDLEEERRMASGIVCLKGEYRDKAIADIQDICSLLFLVPIPTSFKGLHHRLLCP
jgi:hypothetical protein